MEIQPRTLARPAKLAEVGAEIAIIHRERFRSRPWETTPIPASAETKSSRRRRDPEVARFDRCKTPVRPLAVTPVLLCPSLRRRAAECHSHYIAHRQRQARLREPIPTVRHRPTEEVLVHQTS